MTAQLPLPLPRARRRDRSPSHVAAAKALRFQQSHAGRVLAVVCEAGSLTTHEIAQRTGLSVEAVDRRAAEMERAGLIFRVDADLHSLVWHPTSRSLTWFAERRLP